jgi:hypothetical protein
MECVTLMRFHFYTITNLEVENMSFKFNLGDEVKNTLTDFQGVVYGRVNSVGMADRFIVHRKELTKDGDIPILEMDGQELEIVKENSIIEVIEPNFKFNLSDEIKNPNTGYKGIILSRIQWMNGCYQYSVQSNKLHDGKPVRFSFLEPELTLVKAAKKTKEVKKETGAAPSKTKHPSAV